MFVRLLLLMTLVPAIELIMLINFHSWLADHIGGSNALLITIGSILATGILGAQLARSQGFSVLRNFQEASAKGQIPAQEIMDGLMILVGGALLLTPGFLTDFIGFSLLLPITRTMYRKFLSKAVAKGMKSGAVGFQVYQGGVGFGTAHQTAHQTTQQPKSSKGVIEAEYIEPQP